MTVEFEKHEAHDLANIQIAGQILGILKGTPCKRCHEVLSQVSFMLNDFFEQKELDGDIAAITAEAIRKYKELAWEKRFDGHNLKNPFSVSD